MDGGDVSETEQQRRIAASRETRDSCRRFNVPSGAVLSLAALISIAASFTGGFLMYQEGLAAIEETVEELSEAYTLVSTRTLQSAFDEIRWTADMNTVLVPDLEWRSLDDVQHFFRREQWARCSTSEGLYGSAVFVVPLQNGSSNPRALYQMAWWDPLTDQEEIRRNNNSDRLWLTATYTERDWGHIACKPPEPVDGVEYPDSSKRCVHAWALDPATGRAQRRTYSYSDKLINKLSDGDPSYSWAAQQEGWRTSGAAWWRAPSIWQSVDDTPYVFCAYIKVLPAFPDNHPVFGLAKVVLVQYITFFGWQGRLNAKDLLLEDTTVVATLLDEELNSQVLATNMGEVLMRPDCKVQRSDSAVVKRHPCVRVLLELSPTVQDASKVLSRHPENTFLREDISGGEHWLRRRVIHRAQPGDVLPDIYLLWIRPVSSVQDKVERGLYFFLSFLAVIVVVQMLLLLIEWWKVVLPLSRISNAVQLIDDLQLDGAERRLHRVTDVCLVLSEVYNIAMSFFDAIQALQLYRGYLPQGVAPEEGAEDDCPEQLEAVEPPEAGNICIVFTDIQSSTNLWESAPQAMHAALSMHNCALRRIAARNRGYEVKVIGDAFMLAFSSLLDGLRFALEVQKELLGVDWPPELLAHELCRRQETADGRTLWCGLRVRIGVNCGEVHAQRNPVTQRFDYFGPAVNTAARIEGAVLHGGLIGVTQAVTEAVGSEGLRELGSPVVVGMGELEFKGIAGRTAVDILIPSELAERSGLVGSKKPEFGPAAASVRFSVSGRRSSESTLPSSVLKNPLFRSTTSSIRSSNDSDGSVSRNPSAISVTRRGAGGRLALGFSEILASVVCVRHSPSHGTAAEQRYVSLVATMEHNVESCRGVVCTVLSASIVATWNASATCPAHQHAAALFITAVAQPRYATDIHIGARSGGVLAGTVAAGRRRHVCLFGGCVDMALALGSEAELCGDSALMDGDIAAQCDASSVLRAQLWGRPDPADGEIVIWEFITSRDAERTFWGPLSSCTVGLDRLLPAEVFRAAAAGSATAVEALRHRAAVEEAHRDERVLATLARLDAGHLLRRTLPPSVFYRAEFTVDTQTSIISAIPSPSLEQNTLLGSVDS